MKVERDILETMLIAHAKERDCPTTDLHPMAVAATEFLKATRGPKVRGLEDDEGIWCFRCLETREWYYVWLNKRTPSEIVYEWTVENQDDIRHCHLCGDWIDTLAEEPCSVPTAK